MVFAFDIDPVLLLIYIRTFLFVLAVLLMLGIGYIWHDELIAWEDRQIRKAKRFILRQVHKSEKIMRWAQR